MFGLSMTEIILIIVVALLVIGPKKLPELAKSIGKGYGEFKRTFNDLKETVNVDVSSTNSSQKDNNARHQELKEELTQNYKSQWEQKISNTTDNNSDNKEEKRG